MASVRAASVRAVPLRAASVRAEDEMQPLPLVKDESTVTLEIKSLANDLLCPICLECAAA